MFLLVLVTCVTLEGQTMCHEFKREQVFADQVYAMMRGKIVYEGRKSEISKPKLRKSVGV